MEFENNLDAVYQAQQAEKERLSGGISFTDILSDAFMQKHTKYNSLQALLDAANINSPDELENNSAFDNIIKENTDFDNFNSMVSAALQAMFS